MTYISSRYIVFKALRFSPQFSFADVANVKIRFIHLFVTSFMFSLNLSFLSNSIHKYLSLCTCGVGLFFKLLKFLSFISFLLLININFEIFIKFNCIIRRPYRSFLIQCWRSFASPMDSVSVIYKKYVYMYVFVYVCMYVCVFIYVHICMYSCLFVCIM